MNHSEFKNMGVALGVFIAKDIRYNGVHVRIQSFRFMPPLRRGKIPFIPAQAVRALSDVIEGKYSWKQEKLF